MIGMSNLTFLTQNEVGKILRLSPRTLERMRLEGTGPQFRKFGSRVVYALEDCQSWADTRAFNSTSEVSCERQITDNGGKD